MRAPAVVGLSAVWLVAGRGDAQPAPPRADAGPPDDARPAPPHADAGPPGEGRWIDGDHLTGEWGGVRTRLADRGVTIDACYASDAFTAHGATAMLGHVDVALTLDTGKLGLWSGGTLYALGQNNHGSGINDRVGSAVGVSNLEA